MTSKSFLYKTTKSLLLLLVTLSAVYAYFCALSYFWSGFKDSPFGYETCGLENIVWVILITPLLIVSFLIKLILKRYYKYPSCFITSPIFMAVLLFMFTFDKGRGQGYMAIAFIIWEIGVAIYALTVNEKSNV